MLPERIPPQRPGHLMTTRLRIIVLLLGSLLAAILCLPFLPASTLPVWITFVPDPSAIKTPDPQAIERWRMRTEPIEAVQVDLVKSMLVQKGPTMIEELSAAEIWCWPVDSRGAPVPISAIPHASRVGALWLDQWDGIDGESETVTQKHWTLPPFGILFRLDLLPGNHAFPLSPGLIADNQLDPMPGVNLLLPLRAYYLRFGELPSTVPEAIRALRLAPIDQRLAQLTLEGPIRFYCTPQPPSITVGWASNAMWDHQRRALRWDVTTDTLKPVVIPAGAAIWYELKEDGLGPDVPAPTLPGRSP